VCGGALQLRTEMVAHGGARFRCGGGVDSEKMEIKNGGCGDGVGRFVVAVVTGASPSWWLPAMVGHGGG